MLSWKKIKYQKKRKKMGQATQVKKQNQVLQKRQKMKQKVWEDLKK